MPSTKWRPLVCKWGGVTIKDYKHTFIGENVVFDTNFPQDVIIESGVRLTVGCVLLTHFFEVNATDNKYTRGQIKIGKKAYLGCNTIVCKPVNIGEYAVVGAGSVVTKDIPAGEIWAGNPARFIRKRPQSDDEGSD